MEEIFQCIRVREGSVQLLSCVREGSPPLNLFEAKRLKLRRLDTNRILEGARNRINQRNKLSFLDFISSKVFI